MVLETDSSSRFRMTDRKLFMEDVRDISSSRVRRLLTRIVDCDDDDLRRRFFIFIFCGSLFRSF